MPEISPVRRRIALVALVALGAVGAAIALVARRRPPPVEVPPPDLFVRCGEARLRLVAGDGSEPRVQAQVGDGASVELTVRLLKGRMTAHDSAGPGLLPVRGEQGEQGTLRLRCEGDGAALGWAGGEAHELLLVARDAPQLLFVPGGAPQGGEQAAPFATVAWGEAAVTVGAGRFLWRDFPARFEAAVGSEVRLWAGAAATSVAAAHARSGGTVRRVQGQMDRPLHEPGITAVALDAEGRMAAASTVGPDGKFELTSVKDMEVVYAAAGASRAGPAMPARDGVRVQAQVGALRVRVVDHDTGEPLPARVVIQGHKSSKAPNFGTREPNLGAPHRGSGAGPLIEADPDGARVLLPVGVYRVTGTRGLEYTVDTEEAGVVAGSERTLELRLRRVIDTPGWAGCDLHVHSRGSFDSWVSIDDRVRSLMAAGVDLAAASEHNRTGSYEASLVSGQGKWLTWVPAVEVTSVDPLRGHFNVIPYERPEAPRYRRTTLGELVEFVRRESPGSLVQVNHPRMGTLGHFNALHLDPQTQRGLGQLTRGFELLEVYNGFELADDALTDGLVSEWMAMIERGHIHWATGNSDSHTVQYVGVGYPRTYVAAKEDHDGGQGAALDVSAVVAGLRRGQAVATSGPFVEVSQGGRGPGEALEVKDGKARVRVRVRAAPWVSADEVEVFVGGQSALKQPLPEAVGVRVGRPEGSLAEARAAAVRLDTELEVPWRAGARGLVVVVRGSRKVGEVLPFMDWKPRAIVNPMLVEAR